MLVGLLTLGLDRLKPSRTPHGCHRFGRNGLKTAGLSFLSGKCAQIQRRGRPGIAPEFPVCLPFTAANDGPPDSLAESNDGAATVKLERLRHHNPHTLTRGVTMCETLPIAQKNRLNLYGLYGAAPHRLHGWNTWHFLRTTRHKSCDEKYLGVAQAAFPCPPIAPHVPRGNHCARRATRGRQ
jgi:hypothetical protein